MWATIKTIQQHIAQKIFQVTYFGYLVSMVVVGYNITTGNMNILTLTFSTLMSCLCFTSIVVLASRVKWNFNLLISILSILLLAILGLLNFFAAYELITKGWIKCLC